MFADAVEATVNGASAAGERELFAQGTAGAMRAHGSVAGRELVAFGELCERDFFQINFAQ
jgi:hypothetical protein